jgi:hypothetical protein
MRLDAKRERELNRRKGLTTRTIVAIIWLAICLGGAYLFVSWLLETERLRMSFFYGPLHVPYWVSEGWLIAGSVLVIVIIVNFFVLVGFALVNPRAKRHPGTPSMYSSDPDPDDKKYDYR